MNHTFVSTYFTVGFTEVLKVNDLFLGFVLSDSFQKNTRATFSINEKLRHVFPRFASAADDFKF